MSHSTGNVGLDLRQNVPSDPETLWWTASFRPVLAFACRVSAVPWFGLGQASFGPGRSLRIYWGPLIVIMLNRSLGCD